jgi:hypothetical protein
MATEALAESEIFPDRDPLETLSVRAVTSTLARANGEAAGSRRRPKASKYSNRRPVFA